MIADIQFTMNFWHLILPSYNLYATIVWSILFGIILAWYCGAETGLYRLNRLRLHFACKEGNPQALLLENLMKNQQELIATFLIGTNIFSYFITGFVTSYFAHNGYSEIYSEVLSTLILTPLLFVYTEAVPKNCFYTRPNMLMLKSARFIQISYKFLKTLGIIHIFNFLSEYIIKFANKFGYTSSTTENWNHLSSLIRESFASRSLSPLQISLADKIIKLPEQKLIELIIPINRTFAIPIDIPLEKFIEQLTKHQYSFVPVYEHTRNKLIGFVNSYQILIDSENRPISDFVQQMPKIRADERLMIAFEIMKTHDVPIANVVNNRDGTIGIVLLQDIIKDILQY